MTLEVRVPQLPESVADATLVSWHKQPGDPVARDENLVDLETDKVVLEVPAPSAGVLKEIRLTKGATVTSGDVLGVIEPASATSGAVATSGIAAASGAASGTASTPHAASHVSGAPAAAATSQAPKLSPAARRLAEENRLDPAQVSGSGRDGRVSKADVVSHLSSRDSAPSKRNAPSSNAAPASHHAPIDARLPSDTEPPRGASQSSSGSAAQSVRERRVPMSRLRARIAERMVQAQSTQALLTSFNEVDLSQVLSLRARFKEEFESNAGAKLGFMSFFVRACVAALKKFPNVNGAIDGDDIVYHDFYDIGVAVSTDRGLIVPVLRDAGTLSFAQIEKAIAEFARRARDGSITLQELSGGTFTITNGGVFGSLLSTPIVNSPQSAILGMHKIQERPVAVSGQVEIRPMMYVALTYDHRLIDGRDAVQFLVAVKERLEDPSRLLLDL